MPPKQAIVLPSCLAGQQNGRLSPVLLTAGPANTRLVTPAARAWAAMYVAACADGFTGRNALTVTGGGSYRSIGMQQQLWAQRMTPNPVIGRTPVFYAGQAYYLRPGMATVALPGWSNHGLGLALDLAQGATPAEALGLSGRLLEWVKQNAASLGWSPEVDSEPWHWHYFPGDKVPQRVKDIEAYLAAASGA